jgi:hypothetical protein
MKIYSLIAALILVFTCSSNGHAQKGVLYPGFPESFEDGGTQPDGYGKKTIRLSTGRWWFYGALIDSSGNDKPSNGKYAARLNRNNTKPCNLQMNFDVTKGASKVILWYSSYGARADKPCVFCLEYSTDGGKNWTIMGEQLTAKVKVKQAATFEMNVQGPVRFRVHKLALGDESADSTVANGRLSIDDFAVYQN